MKDTLITRVEGYLRWRAYPSRAHARAVRDYLRDRHGANPSGNDLKNALLKNGYAPSGKLGVYQRAKLTPIKPKHCAKAYSAATTLDGNIIEIRPAIATFDNCVKVAKDYLDRGADYVVIKARKP